MIGGLRFLGVGEKMQRRLAAVVLVGEAFVFFFGALVAWAMGRTSGEDSATTYLLLGIVLAVACILATGLLRRPYGVSIGWLLQAAAVAAGLVVPAMYFVGLVFLALWITALVQGDKMDALTRAYTRRNE